MKAYDIAIIGGGMVGMTLAHAIAKLTPQLSCIVIDNQPIENLYAPQLDNRGLALSSTSIAILKKLKLWDLLSPNAHPIDTIHVSSKGKFGFTKIHAKQYQLKSLGSVISAKNIGVALAEKIDDFTNIDNLRSCSVVNLAKDQDAWITTLEHTQVRSKLLVAADGTNSWVRAKLNIATDTHDYFKTAIVCNISHNIEQQNIAYERFTPNGAIAMLPFGKSRAKCIWTVSTKFADEIKEYQDQQFLELLQSEFGYRLNELQKASRRIYFPLHKIRAQTVYKQQALLIGNAANTIHPIAAQGFNLGLRDVITLISLLSNNQALSSYEALRKPDADATCKFTHRLSTLFDNNNKTHTFARQVGLVACDLVPAFNKKIVYQGMAHKFSANKLYHAPQL